MSVKSVDPEEVDAAEILGSAIERREDPRLVTGEGVYTDDIQRPKMAHMALVRSQYAHAEVKDIDTSSAEEMDGVAGVYTFEDLVSEETPGEGEFMLPVGWLLPDLKQVAYPVLANEKVRYQGQPVAVVVAQERYQAHDAADAVDVDYERLDAVTDPAEAVSGGAPQLHDDAPNNVAFDFELGDADAVDDAFASADATASLSLTNQRLVPNAMEPRAAVADFKPGTGELELEMTTQNPHLHRLLLAGVLGFPEHKFHVVAPEVGGGFGSKIHIYPEEALACWTAMLHERPVKIQLTRTESFLTDAHGRGHETDVEVALTNEGDVLGMKVDTKAALGAYLSAFGPAVPTFLYATLLSGQYALPAIHCNVVGAFTNSTPVDAYRGAGRPEASFVVERIMDVAADTLGMDPADIRRRNFVPVDEFPYQTQVASVYDSGDYETAMDKALDMVGYESFRERQEAAREQGRYLGVGISCYIEACGIAPSELVGELGAQAGLWESGTVRFSPSGTVMAYCGTANHGQGHETTYAQILADELGVDYDTIEIVEGDTDEVQQGMGTYGSRSAAVGGSALVESARKVVEKSRKIAAHHLEADESDIEFDAGEFYVSGAPERSMTIQETAGAAYLAHDLPDGMEPGLEATSFYDPENFTFPFGTHVAVVEVDPDTGEVTFEDYVGVDDVGNQINPKIVEGQVQGGVAQGIGQALYEGAVYDENGNLVTGSMQDYAVPKAEHVPEMRLDETITECPHNPLGVKGVGEAGTIAAAQAVVNAVDDALSPLGVDRRDLDMPLTGETVWRAIQNAEGGA